MRYYLIAGEPSGDLHASRLMRALKERDPQAAFRFYGGDLMAAEGGTLVRHYRDMAFMGIVPVVLHLRTILRNMALCKRDIMAWRPDVVILVDYPGFNLSIADYLHRHARIPVYYYIAPKVWASREYRAKKMCRCVDEMFSILPFEVDYFAKWNYPVHYVGNPTADEVDEFRRGYHETARDFALRHGLPSDRPFIALLPGSRLHEIEKNLPGMMQAARRLPGRTLLVAAPRGVDRSVYERLVGTDGWWLVEDDTYALLSHAEAALVTSGTATLETALFDVPQVVCYNTTLPWLVSRLRPWVLHVDYVSLVNLIAGREVVRELVAADFSVGAIERELSVIVEGGSRRQAMLEGYAEVRRRLGKLGAPANAAAIMVALLTGKKVDIND